MIQVQVLAFPNMFTIFEKKERNNIGLLLYSMCPRVINNIKEESKNIPHIYPSATPLYLYPFLTPRTAIYKKERVQPGFQKITQPCGSNTGGIWSMAEKSMLI